MASSGTEVCRLTIHQGWLWLSRGENVTLSPCRFWGCFSRLRAGHPWWALVTAEAVVLPAPHPSLRLAERHTLKRVLRSLRCGPTAWPFCSSR